MQGKADIVMELTRCHMTVLKQDKEVHIESK